MHNHILVYVRLIHRDISASERCNLEKKKKNRKIIKKQYKYNIFNKFKDFKEKKFKVFPFSVNAIFPYHFAVCNVCYAVFSFSDENMSSLWNRISVFDYPLILSPYDAICSQYTMDALVELCQQQHRWMHRNSTSIFIFFGLFSQKNFFFSSYTN